MRGLGPGAPASPDPTGCQGPSGPGRVTGRPAPQGGATAVLGGTAGLPSLPRQGPLSQELALTPQPPQEHVPAQ